MWKLLFIALFFYCVLSETEIKQETQSVVVEHKEVKYGGPPVDEFYAETTITETEDPTTEP